MPTLAIIGSQKRDSLALGAEEICTGLERAAVDLWQE